MEKFYVKMSNWQDFYFNVENHILTDLHILRAINSLWNKKINKNLIIPHL